MMSRSTRHRARNQARRTRLSRHFSFERLEWRALLSGDPNFTTYLPQQHNLFNYGGYLTGPSSDSPITIAENYLRAHAADLGLVAGDLDNYLITTDYTTASTGITTLTFEQSLHGLAVANANFNITVLPDGRLLEVTGGFVPGLSARAEQISVMPQMTSRRAVMAAAKDLGLVLPGAPTEVGDLTGDGTVNADDVSGLLGALSDASHYAAEHGFSAEQFLTVANVNGDEFTDNLDMQALICLAANRADDLYQTAVWSAPSISLDDISANLQYVATAGDNVSLSWNLTLRTPDGAHWYNVSVDCSSGEMVAMVDYADDATYEVYAIPATDPNDHPRSIQTDPYVITPPPAIVPSPFGWHDTNGVAGAEFTITSGNNVNAYADRNNDNLVDAGSQPSGGASLNFTGPLVPIDFTQAPVTYTAAAVTNLFYWNNILHDLHYLYGFDEASRNFQVNNYGRGGTGGDAVNAEAQDGGGTNNANFAAPPDGTAPRMQMYEFTSTTPRRDGDLDPEIIIHEYGHGVSNRLTGNGSGLNALQSGGMGEGWSDWWSLMFTQESASETTDGRGVGTYVLGQPTTGLGIREFKYDFDITDTNQQTFISYGAGSTEVHQSGTRWAATLWDINKLLIDKYGFEPNVFNVASTAGNIRALKLVMSALKIQALNPTFIQARDAILMADQALFGGADLLQLWTAFARRGIGQGASTPSSSSSSLTTSFIIPPEVLGLAVTTSTPAANSTVATPPTTFVINFSDPIDPATLGASDLTVNSMPAENVSLSADGKIATFTYNTSPVTSQGQQSMAMAAGAVVQLGDPTRTLFPFSANFRYDVVVLQVTSTNPSPGSIYTLPGPFTLDVNFNEPVDPASVTPSSLGLAGISGAVVTGASVFPGNTSARFTLSGITSEGTLTATIAAGAVTDAFGNPGTPFTANYTFDVSTAAFPVPLNAVAPAGSLVYDPAASGIIGVVGDSDTFTLAVDPGQTISVLVTPTTSGLVPNVTLLSPASGTLASAVAIGAGQNALIQSVPANFLGGGNYRIVVTGSGATTGSYTVQVILNATLENEGNLVGTSFINNTIATAQPIDSSFIRLSSGTTPSRGALLGQTDNATFTASAVGFSFENISSSGTTITGLTGTDDASVSIPIGFSFPFFGTTNTSVFVSSNGLLTFGSADADYQNSDLTTSPTQATIAPFWDDLLVSGGSNSTVRYQVLGSGTNQHLTIQWNQITFFSGGTTGDTLTFEAQLYVDGRIQFNYLDLTSGGSTSNNGASATVGVKAAGTQGTNRLLLAFNNGPNSFVGTNRSTLLTPPVGTADYYRVALSAGDRITVAATSLGSGNVNVDLRNTSDGVLATGVAGPTNVSKIISNFLASAPTTYYLRVTGDLSTPYSLVITRNAVFDTEANDTFATAKSMDGNAGALGSINSLVSSATTINFTELSARPVDGVSLNGLTFGFTINGISSTDATFGGAGPGTTLYTTPPQLEGNTGGILSMTFTSPTPTLSFPVVLSATGTVTNAATIQLFDAASNLISTTSLTTSVPPGFTFTEGLFTYNGLTPVKQARVSFNSAAAGRFVLDNIAFGVANTPDNDWYSLTLATGSVISLATSTPADGAGEFVNTLAPSIEVYSPAGALLASGVVGPDGRNQTLTYIAPTAGAYRVHVSGAASTRGEYFLASQVTPLSTVQTVTIDDGTAQRSRVRSITLTFNGVITSAPSSAFQIIRTEDGAVIPVIASALTPLSGGRTQVMLTFGGTLDAGSLADGRYALVIDGSQIIDSFDRKLDAAGTGTAGSTKSVSFHRFFGDANGDGQVDAADFFAFDNTYQSGNALGAGSIFDADGDGAFTQADLDAFTKNFTTRVLN